MKVLFFTKEAFYILLTAVIFTVLPIVVFTLITTKGDLIPGFKTFTVLTGSMSPLIPPGSLVYFYKSQNYVPGDIISFERGTINVTHRIVAITNEKGERINPASIGNNQKIFYQTKGDANKNIDPELVPESKVIGEALFHFPYIGRFMAYLRTMPGFLRFIVLPTVVFISFELWNIKKEIEKETEKRVLNKILQKFEAYG